MRAVVELSDADAYHCPLIGPSAAAAVVLDRNRTLFITRKAAVRPPRSQLRGTFLALAADFSFRSRCGKTSEEGRENRDFRCDVALCPRYAKQGFFAALSPATERLLPPPSPKWRSCSRLLSTKWISSGRFRLGLT